MSFVPCMVDNCIIVLKCSTDQSRVLMVLMQFFLVRVMSHDRCIPQLEEVCE